MNIPRISFLTFLSAIVLSVILISACMFIAVARGEYVDPTIRVNVNEQTDLFEKSIDDYSSFADQLEEQQDTAAGGAKSEAGLDFLVKEDKGKTITAADSLAAIPATELNSRAAEAVMQEDTMNDLYVDYSSPLNKQAIIDARKIAKGQDALLANLLDKLKEIGVDCRTVKGVKQQEPAYYMQIQQTQHQDTVYNRAICEELRNQYNCRDSVSLTCKRKGKRYGEWEERTITMVFHETPVHWWILGRYTDSTFHGRNGHGVDMTSRTINPSYNGEITETISNKLGVLIDQIQVSKQNIVLTSLPRHSRNVDFSNCIRPWGGFYFVRDALITFDYKYRSSTEICEQWSEDWTESCHLNSLVKPVVNKAGQRGK